MTERPVRHDHDAVKQSIPDFTKKATNGMKEQLDR